MGVTENIARIRDSLGQHAITLVAVTKSAELPQIEEAHRTGVTEFGESRIQDALAKMNNLPDWLMDNSHWHFIGHLQSNKVKQAVGRFALIHSVDSLNLAREISRTATQKGITQQILLQVKMASDPNKSGFEPADLRQNLGAILELPHLALKGLMTITPLNASPNDRLACFAGLRMLRDELARKYGVVLPELSMGMTNDWREAITCGATIVRIGSEIFRQ
jgi:pyridoxal phosphate enzyme (YggS family)